MRTWQRKEIAGSCLWLGTSGKRPLGHNYLFSFFFGEYENVDLLWTLQYK